MKNALPRKTKAQLKTDAAFEAAFEARMVELGAVRGEHREGAGLVGLLGGYIWKLETVAGPLLITCHGDWVATRFVDVERAKEYVDHSFGGGGMNPYSGKWNTHFDNDHTVEDRMHDVEYRLSKVLPATV
jgi:hypothetical protein